MAAKSEGLVSITVRVTPEVKEALQAQADKDFRDVNSQIRKVLSQWHAKWVSNNARGKHEGDES